MRRAIEIVALTATIYALSCATWQRETTPVLRELTIRPQPAAPGGTMTITAVIYDPSNKVEAITATLREYPTEVWVLENAPAKSGISEWSTVVSIPSNAPEGNYNIDLTLRAGSGEPILADEKVSVQPNMAFELRRSGGASPSRGR